MTTPSGREPSRMERGLAVLEQVGGGVPTPLDALADIAPDLGRYAVEFAYGDLYTRPALDLRERQLVTVAALVAFGNAAPQLRFHLAGALNVGCTRRQIVEVLIHSCVYAGFPAALNGIAAAREVFEATGDASTTEESAPVVEDNRYERGLAALTAVDGHAGEAVIAALADIAPDLGRYIVEFSFGDIYSRPGLSLRTRELVTIAMCAATGTAAPQLRVHIHGLLNVGGTRTEVVEVMTHLAAYAGFPAALNGITVAREVFAERAAAESRESA